MPNMCIMVLRPDNSAIFVAMDPVGDVSHSGGAFFDYHQQVINELTVNRSHRFDGLIVDNVPASMVSLRLQLLQSLHPRMLGIPCYAHTFNLLAKQLGEQPNANSCSQRTDGVAVIINMVLQGLEHLPQRWGVLAKISNNVLNAKDAFILLTAAPEELAELPCASKNSHHINKVANPAFI
ncbi:hypothetical protein FOA52_006943 [Chlamydomonas sp. UWO 241]|nr:hypothetical protein FOA52_006943 [Chlamydomonas sp. UWO 241]